MIYLLYGLDTDKARSKANELIAALQKKKPDAAFFKLTDENVDAAVLDEYIGGQGLFSNKYIVFLDNVFKNREAKENVIKKIKEIGASENIFIILEQKIDKASFGKIEKATEKTQLFDKEEDRNRAEELNIFALADALSARNRLQLWLVYLETVKRNIAPEEVSGILFWKVKDMITKKNFGRYSPEELQQLSSRLVSIYHDAHRGVHDFGITLEKFTLSI